MWMARPQLIHFSVSRLEDEERIALQERVLNAEAQLKARITAGDVTNQGAESLNQRIKNARTELVSWIS